MSNPTASIDAETSEWICCKEVTGPNKGRAFWLHKTTSEISYVDPSLRPQSVASSSIDASVNEQTNIPQQTKDEDSKSKAKVNKKKKKKIIKANGVERQNEQHRREASQSYSNELEESLEEEEEEIDTDDDGKNWSKEKMDDEVERIQTRRGSKLQEILGTNVKDQDIIKKRQENALRLRQKKEVQSNDPCGYRTSICVYVTIFYFYFLNYYYFFKKKKKINNNDSSNNNNNNKC
ncbi:hypothetical protein RFI_11336 [Reticulomyxa filosa]|uniref:Uncharacterized protein n=1 Tax=Reticulomyxa filosa TaxID=46433 RepID=X6NHK2_RETFI|nr:hypothetical protein RFI_11336 [Reticulomyxa filosa]|eukprot:ETO25800.1 hypothetical protein RFI_11336 [Reticulomyxa filosa]